VDFELTKALILLSVVTLGDLSSHNPKSLESSRRFACSRLLRPPLAGRRPPDFRSLRPSRVTKTAHGFEGR
jgi:hypothetical protein